jgi:hypothetical protein
MKRPALKSALQAAAGGGRKPAAANEAAGRTPARVGKRQIAAFFEPEVGRALKLLAAEGDTTVQALLSEALNDLFAKHGKPPIA